MRRLIEQVVGRRIGMSRREKIGLTGLVVLGVFVRVWNIGAPLSGTHLFRFSQTAWGVRSVSEGVRSPFNVEMPVMGPPWRVPFEFPLYQLIAGTISRYVGLSVEASGRLTSIFFFIATSVAMYALCRRYASALTSLIVLAVFLFCAYNLEYGSAILIDYCALFFGLTAFLVANTFLSKPNSSALVLFTCLSITCALVKITTSVVWIGVGSVLACYLASARWTSRVKVLLAACLSHFPAVAWTRWSDLQKSKSLTTAWLTSDSLRQWNFGTLGQRLSLRSWIENAPSSILPSTIGIPIALIVVLAIAIAATRERRVLIVAVILSLSGPAIFSNLYVVHDYYWIAVMPALGLIFALGLDQMLSLISNTQYFSLKRQRSLGVLLALSISFLSWGTDQGLRHFEYWRFAGSAVLTDERIRIAVETIKSNTLPDDNVVVLGFDWDPSILYLADRKGLLIPPAVEPAFLQNSPELGSLYRYVYLFGDFSSEQLQDFFGSVQLLQVSDRLFRFPSQN